MKLNALHYAGHFYYAFYNQSRPALGALANIRTVKVLLLSKKASFLFADPKQPTAR